MASSPPRTAAAGGEPVSLRASFKPHRPQIYLVQRLTLDVDTMLLDDVRRQLRVHDFKAVGSHEIDYGNKRRLVCERTAAGIVADIRRAAKYLLSNNDADSSISGAEADRIGLLLLGLIGE